MSLSPRKCSEGHSHSVTGFHVAMGVLAEVAAGGERSQPLALRPTAPGSMQAAETGTRGQAVIRKG